MPTGEQLLMFQSSIVLHLQGQAIKENFTLNNPEKSYSWTPVTIYQLTWYNTQEDLNFHMYLLL
jgi:hypothetical protein